MPLNLPKAQALRFCLGVVLGACGCALMIGFGVEAFMLLPFSIIAVAVFVNNAFIFFLLAPLLLKLLEPRVSRWDLYWRDLMDPEDYVSGAAPGLGLALAWLGAAGGIFAGLGVAWGLVALPMVSPLALLLAPFVVVLLLGCVLM